MNQDTKRIVFQETEDQVVDNHRTTMFSAGAKREGLMDRPYDEGDVL